MSKIGKVTYSSDRIGRTGVVRGVSVVIKQPLLLKFGRFSLGVTTYISCTALFSGQNTNLGHFIDIRISANLILNT